VHGNKSPCNTLDLTRSMRRGNSNKQPACMVSGQKPPLESRTSGTATRLRAISRAAWPCFCKTAYSIHDCKHQTSPGTASVRRVGCVSLRHRAVSQSQGQTALLMACRRLAVPGVLLSSGGSAGRPAHHACRPGRLFVRMISGTCSLSGLVCYKAFCYQALLKPALQSVNPTM